MNHSDEITEKFKSLGSVKVKEIMSTDIITLKEDDEFLDFIAQIKDKGYFGFPVVNKYNEIVGIITQSDLLKLILFHGSRAAKMIELESFTGISTVRSVMSTHPLTLEPEDTIDDAAAVMAEYGIQSIPVVEERTVVGIICKKDILNKIFENLDDLRILKG
ncbi:hypothetical protein BEH94_07460 [Candidatus Altiarchaeales archaeon WOR_SM1_SCG]|nr:hypothetical protein BEH94_07460 [Candidatus Altiarchaeales archaeon WOR_SM1_SCG]